MVEDVKQLSPKTANGSSISEKPELEARPAREVAAWNKPELEAPPRFEMDGESVHRELAAPVKQVPELSTNTSGTARDDPRQSTASGTLSQPEHVGRMKSQRSAARDHVASTGEVMDISPSGQNAVHRNTSTKSPAVDDDNTSLYRNVWTE